MFLYISSILFSYFSFSRIVFVPEECLVDASDATSQDEQSEAESLSESLKLSDINEDPKEKESNSSS